MRSILKKIITAKKKEIQRAKSITPLDLLAKEAFSAKDKTRGFLRALSAPGINCIGELKKASPAKGWLREKLNLVRGCRLYEKSGIRAISVHTDKHFKGKLADLRKVKNACSLPILRKDFIIDPYQIYESRLAGADAVLLIAAILRKSELNTMRELAEALGMDVLVEIHDQREIRKLDLKRTSIIGINNRDLKNFSVDIKHSARVKRLLPENKVIVSESGINTRADVLFLAELGINAVLIGEGIVASPNMSRKIKELLGKR